MKLYVWKNPYYIPYGGTCLFVIAKDIKQAKKLAQAAEVSEFGFIPEEIGAQKFKLSDPDWVKEIPYAFIYHWEE